MTEWLMSANAKRYNHQKAFAEQGFIYWRQIRNFSEGDIVYIYCTKPIGRIQYEVNVDEIDVPFENVLSERKYYSDEYQQKEGNYIKMKLKRTYNGEKMDTADLSRFGFIPPQGPQRISNQELLKYVNSVFKEEQNEQTRI